MFLGRVRVFGLLVCLGAARFDWRAGFNLSWFGSVRISSVRFVLAGLVHLYVGPRIGLSYCWV